jgi:septum formation protein
VESTKVTFRTLPAEEIEEYVRGGSPMDKAGAYGIQDDYGAVFVTRIEGCYYNVVGLPLARVYQALRSFSGFPA